MNPDAPYEVVGTTLDRFAAKYGLTEEAAARVAGTFGGGMGKTGSVCGCVAAMCMVQGLRNAPAVPDPAAQREANAGYRERAKAFGEAFGSTMCRELLPAAQAKGPGPGGSRPCWIYVDMAARLLAEPDGAEG